MQFLLYVFYIASLLIIHTYFVYPLIVLILSKVRKFEHPQKEYQPPISLIISAYNEESIIEKTVRNLINSDYNPKKLEIIVGSDNSVDKTNKIMDELSEEFENIKFFPFAERRGKSAVLNDLVERSSAEILVFTDANTHIYPDAIGKLVRYYTNEKIGGVCGRLVLVDNLSNRSSGYEEKNYWDLESRLKKLEGDIGILIGANGGIYSIRKSLFKTIPVSYPVVDDFYISMKVLEQKKKMIYESKAIAEENIAPSVKAEFSRKIRINAIALSTLKALKKLLSPSYGYVAFSFWSHKVIRWFSPLLLLLILITNVLLMDFSIWFRLLFYIQVCFYSLSFFGFLLRSKSFYPKFLVMPFYFTMTNIAMFIGLIKFMIGIQTSFWQSTPRK